MHWISIQKWNVHLPLLILQICIILWMFIMILSQTRIPLIDFFYVWRMKTRLKSLYVLNLDHQWKEHLPILGLSENDSFGFTINCLFCVICSEDTPLDTGLPETPSLKPVKGSSSHWNIQWLLELLLITISQTFKI